MLIRSMKKMTVNPNDAPEIDLTGVGRELTLSLLFNHMLFLNLFFYVILCYLLL